MPSYNAEGQQVWDPAVGIYFKPGAVKRESFGGIIAAFQDLQVENGYIPKSYPENFAGIISAIQDLKLSSSQVPVIPGPNPGNGQIIIDSDGNPEWIDNVELQDGTLWFDTRQGRLFVLVEGEWTQTNGADGLAVVTENEQPDIGNPVLGQFWWDAENNDLYIFDGTYSYPGGLTQDPTLTDATPVWKLITDGLVDAFQTTLTLPLGSVGPKIVSGTLFEIIPDPDPTVVKVQADYNVWLYDALKELDTFASDLNQVFMGEAYDGTPRAGSLWYDTSSLEMSIWYEDEDGGQWVPTASAYSYDDDIATLQAKIATETTLRETALYDVYARVESLQSKQRSTAAIESKLDAVSAQVNSIPAPVDVTPYATTASVTSSVSALTTQINAVTTSLSSLSQYATASELQQLETAVGQLPTTSSVTASIAAAQPNLSSYVTQADINTSISNITTDYLPTTGGTLSGAFVVNKTDMAAPAFDFSAEKWYSYNTHKYRTNSITTDYATFGTNEKPWEYEWDFSSNEDFCWVYNDTNKVFSITKDGPACSQLYLADFQPNSNSGRVLTNTIDVKDRLVKYQSAFETMRQGVSNSTDFDSLKANLLTALASV